MSLSSGAQAAVITWAAPKNITADSDVSTNGVLLKAVSLAGTNYPTVNGVTFTPAYAGDSISGVNASNAAAGTLPVGGGIGAAYSTLLSRNVYAASAGSSLTLTLKGLTVGHHYELQIWANDSDSSPLGTQTVKSPGALDPWVLLNMNSTGTAGGKGQFGLGTFTADSTNQTVTIQGSASPVLQAYQVRRVTNPLAAVGWSLWQETTNQADVKTNGTSVRAYVFGSSAPAAAINGVTFTRFASQSADTLNGFTVPGVDSFGSTNAPYANLSSDYKKIVGSAAYGGQSASLTLNNLLPGQWYAVQVWANDSRAVGADRTVRINGSVFLNLNPGGPSDNPAYEGNLGHHMTGIFQASAASQRLDFVGSDFAQVNGLQLRAIPAVDPLVYAAKMRRQFTLNSIIDGKLTDGDSMAKVHLDFGAGQIAKGKADAYAALMNWGYTGSGYTFAGWQAMDIVIRYKKYIDTASRNAVVNNLPAINYVTPGTANLQKIAWHMRFLGSEEFGEGAFVHPKNDFRTSDPNARKVLLQRLNDEATLGSPEFASNDYGILNLLPSLSLSQLAKDPEVRARATASFPAMLAQMAAVWQGSDNYIGTWSWRSYEDQNGHLGVFGRLLWQALGGAPSSYVAKSMALLVASDYEVPAPILHAGNDRTMIYTSRQGSPSAFHSSYVSSTNYILFSTCDHDDEMNNWSYPYGVRWAGMVNFFWLSAPVTDYSTDIRAAENHGTSTASMGVLQHGNTVVYAFDFTRDKGSYVPYALSQVPGGYAAAINDSTNLGRIFLHYGRVMIAVASDIPFTWKTNSGIWSPRNTPQPGDSEFRVAYPSIGDPMLDGPSVYDPNSPYKSTIDTNNNRFAMAIETALPSDYPGATPAEQLSAFRSNILATTGISHLNVFPCTATYTNRSGDVLKKQSYDNSGNRKPGYINGVSVDYANWPMLENPWMTQDNKKGPLTVTAGDQRVVLNFTNWTVTNLTLTLPGAQPQISSDTPAGLTTASAVFRGTLLATGAGTPSVWLYWGNSDGGTNKASWSTNVALGPRGLGSVATNLTGLLGSTTYYYRYYASNSAGGAWSSNSVSFATLQTPPPPPPGLLTHTLTVGVVPIAWQTSLGATSYTIKRSLTSGGLYTILQSGVSVTNYTDLLVTNGTVYYYVATATGPGGESGNSGEVAGTPAVIPAVPTGLAASMGYTNVSLNWNATPWATGYNVKRSQVSGGPYTLIGTPNGPSFSDNTATNGGTYYYVVSATNFVGESANSAQAAITVAFTSFLNWTAGNWNAVTWFPSPPGQPVSGTGTVLEFINGAPINSTNNLGTFTLNRLHLVGQSVNLAGNPLAFGGTLPLVTNFSDTTHTIANAITLNSAGTFGVGANTLTVSGVISGANNLIKTGDGKLKLAGNNSYTGSTILTRGTLEYATNNLNLKTLYFGQTDGSSGTVALLATNANVTATNLTVWNDDEATNTITLGATRTLTINGALNLYTLAGNAGSKLRISGGTFTINSAVSDLVVGYNSVDTANTRHNLLDLRGLNTFNATVNDFRIGYNSTVNYASAGFSTVYLAPASTITADTLSVGIHGITAGQSTSKLFLGAGTNIFNVNTLTVGDQQDDLFGNVSGELAFGDGGGILFLRGKAGGSSGIANMYVGSKTDTGSVQNHTGLADFSGGPVFGAISNLYVGYQTSRGGSGNPKAYGTFTLGDGSGASALTVTALRIGYETDSDTGNRAVGTAIINDGTLNVGTIELTHDTNATATLKILGGRVSLGGDITTLGGSESLTLDGGMLEMQGHKIGNATNTVGTVNFLSGTLRNLASINGTAGLVKSGSDTLTVEGVNTYTGGTTVSSGTLVVDGSVAGNVTVSSSAILGGGGSIGGAVTASGTLAPGAVGQGVDSVGTLTVGALTLPSAGQMVVTLTNVSSGAGNGWDFVNASAGAVTVSATSNAPIVIALDTQGVIPDNWNPGVTNQWKIISGASLTGFAANLFTVDPSLFAGDSTAGSFSVAQIGNDLYLNYTPFPPPAAPLGLMATPNERLVTLSWNPSASALGYNVRRGTTNSGPYTLVAANIVGTMFNDSTVANGTTYYYVVTAWNLTGESANSLPVSVTPPGAMAAWRNRLRLGFENYPDNETLTNFPVLVVLGTNVSNFAYDQVASSSGKDLRFTDGLGNETSYEIEKWNTNGLSYVWVRVPALNSRASLWAYWGNANTLSAPAYTTNGATWTNRFIGVWHLAETNGVHRDSSPRLGASRFVQATVQGAATGMAGGCDDFNGTNDYVSLPDMGINTNVTVECWVNLNATPGGGDIGLVSSDPWSAGITHFKTSSTFQLKAQINGAGTVNSANNLLSMGNWAYAAYTIAGNGATDIKTWLNAALVGSSTGATNNNLTDVNIAREFSGRYLNARVDEVRISNIARSTNWLQATYQNLAANDSFVGYGTAESITPMTPQVMSAAFGTGGFQLQISGSLGFNHTVQASTNLVTWTHLFTTNPTAVPFVWTDSNSTNFNRRFYRVLVGP